MARFNPAGVQVNYQGGNRRDRDLGTAGAWWKRPMGTPPPGTTPVTPISPVVPSPITPPEVMTPGPGLNAAAPIAPYLGANAGLVTADQANINALLNPSFNTFETDTRAAERAVGSGTSGSGFAGNVRFNMLDSERMARTSEGNRMLAGYLDRDASASQAQADRDQRYQLAIMEGQQAMERLRLSESGQSERLSAEARHRLEQIAAQGRLAAEDRRDQIRGNIANTVVGSSGGSGGSGGGGSSGGGTGSDPYGRTRVGPPGYNDVSSPYLADPNYWQELAAAGRPKPVTSSSSGGVSSSGIDRILAQYGLLGSNPVNPYAINY